MDRLYERTVDLDAGLTLADLALALGVRPGTARNWANRGWIAPDGSRRHLTVVGKTDRGHHLYRYGDGLAAERDTSRSPNTPGRRLAYA